MCLPFSQSPTHQLILAHLQSALHAYHLSFEIVTDSLETVLIFLLSFICQQFLWSLLQSTLGQNPLLEEGNTTMVTIITLQLLASLILTLS